LGEDINAVGLSRELIEVDPNPKSIGVRCNSNQTPNSNAIVGSGAGGLEPALVKHIQLTIEWLINGLARHRVARAEN
jgi:hypothetical protein